MGIANVKVEPCKVLWDGVDLGLTEGDLEISPEEQAVDITAHQTGTNLLGAIRTGSSIELSVTLKETTKAQVESMLLAGGGSTDDVAQIANLTCVADVSKSLHGKCFPLIAQDGTQYLFQLKENATALVPPVITDWTVIQVGYDENDGANTIADLVAAAIDLLAGFVAPNPGAAIVAITWADGGVVPSGSGAGNSGFTFAVQTAGSSALTGWGTSKQFLNQLDDAAKLVLHPVAKADDDLSEDLAFWKAYPMLGSIVQSGENPKTVQVTFKIFHDYTKSAAVRLFGYGVHE